MRHAAFAIFDIKSGLYTAPFFQQNRAVATRSFYDLMVDTAHNFHRHVGDYELRGIGSWDDETGELIGTDPVQIVNGPAVLAFYEAHGPQSVKEVRDFAGQSVLEPARAGRPPRARKV